MVTFSSMYQDRPTAGESEAAVERERRRWPEEEVEKERRRRSDVAASAGVGGRRREGERGFLLLCVLAGPVLVDSTNGTAG
jgi:hypothetical protein